MVKPRPLHKKNGLLLAEMTRHGYTIESLSQALGVHYLTVWRIVNRQHRPSRRTAAKLSELLECTATDLGLEVWHPAKQAGTDAGTGATDSDDR